MDFDVNILQQALASATLTKILVDLVRQTAKCKSWTFPLLAVAFGIISSLLLALSVNVPLDVPIISKSIIAGILAAGSAIGVTELQKRAL
jgi:hypothetical protein